jgi:hypothetical protein
MEEMKFDYPLTEELMDGWQNIFAKVELEEALQIAGKRQ